MTLQPVLIGSYSEGLQTDKKPFLLMDGAFQQLNNAYVWRERVKKREGIKLVGRLRRVFTTEAMGNNSAGASTSFNIITQASISETNAELEPGSIEITVGAPDSNVFTDDGDGTFTVTGAGNGIEEGSSINYATGDVVLAYSPDATGGSAMTADFNYFPSEPTMGIGLRDVATVNVEQTIIFDTIYAYVSDNDNFNELSSTTPTTWQGDDTDFFWTTNYRGATGSQRLFFATNFNINGASSDPIRYYNGSTWADLQPVIGGAGGGSEETLYQAKIIVPYYGRLVTLNTWEGTTAASYGGSANYFNRCRFSQIGDPTAADAWYSDVFGKGGFVDAPTGESIVSAEFYKDLLIVFFEQSTWALQYVGEYGLPFVWERISSDLGSESTFSAVKFDSGVLAVGDKGIITATSNQTQRIDEQIPDLVFEFENENGGKERVQGIRDFQKELVYWCYATGAEDTQSYPANVLVFNYKNNTWAIFRDNVTVFGILTSFIGDSWDEPTSWDLPVSWDFIEQGQKPAVISGNQQGYIHWYQTPLDLDNASDSAVDAQENESLSITDITRSATDPLNIEVINHNLQGEEIIYLTGINYIDTDSTVLPCSLNDSFFQVQIVDADNLKLYFWDQNTASYLIASGNNLSFTPATGTGTYMGGGQVTLIPKMEIRTKDFNPFQGQGKQMALSYIDFQTDATPNSAINVNLALDSESSTYGNLLVGNSQNDTTLVKTGLITGANQDNPCRLTSPNHSLKTGEQITILNVKGMTELNNLTSTVTFVDLNTLDLDDIDSSAFTAYSRAGNWFSSNPQYYYIPNQQYAWHRFYATAHGQYISIYITYDAEQMNTLETHQGLFEMNAMQLWVRNGGRLP